MSDAHCPECGHYCADHIGQPCVSCFWRLKNEERDRVMGEAAAKAAKEEAVKINLKRDIQASLDKIEALKAEMEGLRVENEELEERNERLIHAREFADEFYVKCGKERDAYKAQRDELATQIDAMEAQKDDLKVMGHAFIDENGRLASKVREARKERDELREKVRGLEHDCDYWRVRTVEARKAADAALAKLAAMEKRTTAVYDGCSDLTEENEELRSEVRRLTEVSLGLAAIVVGKG